jgi:hypothetical protein
MFLDQGKVLFESIKVWRFLNPFESVAIVESIQTTPPGTVLAGPAYQHPTALPYCVTAPPPTPDSRGSLLAAPHCRSSRPGGLFSFSLCHVVTPIGAPSFFPSLPRTTEALEKPSTTTRSLFSPVYHARARVPPPFSTA